MFIGTSGSDANDTLLKKLASGSVTISTVSTGLGTGNITVSAPISTAAAGSALTLDATGHAIALGASITTAAAGQTYNGAITLSNPVSLTSTSTGGPIALNGTVDGASNLTINTGGAITFGGAIGNSTPLAQLATGGTGAINLNAGVVKTSGLQSWGNAITLGTNTTLQSTAAGITAGSISGNSHSLAINQATAGSISGVIAGLTALTVSGTGPLTLSGTNTFTGSTTVNGGTLVISSDANLGAVPGSPAPGNLTLAGGGTLKTSGTITLNSNRGIELGTGGGVFSPDLSTLNIGGIIAGAGSLTKTGSGGILELTGANTYAGGTIVTGGGGTLVISADNNLGAVPGTVTPASITLDNGNLLARSSLTIDAKRGITLGAGGGGLMADPNQTLTYGGVVTGSAPLKVMSMGKVVLSGANTYTGSTSIATATLEVATLVNGGIASGIGASSNAAANLVLDGGTLKYAGTGASTDRLFTLSTAGGALDASGTGALAFGATGAIALGGSDTARTLTLTGTSTAANTLALTLADNGSGPSSLTKSGSGTWALTGANTYTGATTVNGGNLAVGYGGTTGSIAGNVTLGGGQLQFVRANDYAYAGNITGTGTVGNYGKTVTLSGANTYTGNTFIQSVVPSTTATLADGVAGTYSPNSAMIVSGGATPAVLQVNFNETIGGLNNDQSNTGGSVVFANSSVLTINNAAANNTFSGIISGAGSLAKQGAGTLTLSGGNTYNGATTIKEGSLKLGTGGSLPSGTNMTLAGLAGTTATFDLNNQPQTIGSLTLGGANAAAGANVTLNGGTLTLGGNVTYDAANQPLGASITGGTLALGATRTFNIGDSATATTELTVSSVVGGAGGVTKTGAGMLALSGGNTYTGATTISGGTLAVDWLSSVSSPNPLGQSPNAAANLVIDGGTLQYKFTGTGQSTDRLFTVGPGGATIDVAGTGTIDFSNTGSLAMSGAGSRSLTLTGTPTNPSVLRSVIGDPSGGVTNLVKSGSGMWSLNAANTFTGTTTITGGTLRLGDALALQNSRLDYNNQGGTLASASSTVTLGGLTGGQSLSLTTLSATALALTVAPTGTTDVYSGSLSGSGSLTKAGTGTWTLTGANTYTGVTTAAAGTLQFAKQSALYNNTPANWTATNLVVNSGATAAFNVGGTGEFTTTDIGTLAALGTATGGFKNGAFLGLDTTNAGGAFTYSGIIGNPNGGANTLGLVKLGTGTLTLSGANTYTGGTKVSSGRLGIGATNALPTAAGIDVVSGAFLDVDNNQSAAALTGAGTVTTASEKALTLTNGTSASTFNGTLAGTGKVIVSGGTFATGTGAALNGGTLQIGTGGTAGALSGNVAIGAGGSLVFNRSDVLNYGGQLTGTGSLTKLGAGTLSLTGNNNLSGQTTVNGGRLQVSAWAGGDVMINETTSNGTSVFDATAATVSIGSLTFGGAASVSSATNNLDLAGGATLTLGGNVTYLTPSSSSPLMSMILGGTLNLGATTRTFDVGDSSVAMTDLSITSLLGGSAGVGLTKTGEGTLRLGHAASTFLGPVAIQRGTLTVDTLANSGLPSALGAGTTIAVGSTEARGTFDYNGASATTTNRTVELVGSLSQAVLLASNAGKVTFSGGFTGVGTGSKTLILGGNGGGGGEISGGITDGAGVVSLVKTGGNTWTLSAVSGANTYTGSMVIDSGTLRLGANGTLPGTTPVSLTPGSGSSATFNVNGFSQAIGSLSFGGAGTSTVSLGAGTLTLGGDVNYDAAGNPFGATISGGTLALGTTRYFNVGNSVNSFNELAISSVINGSDGAGIVKTGAGTLILSGASNYTGGTEIAAGRLQLGVNGALPSTTNVYLNPYNSDDFAVLDLANRNQAIGSLTFSGDGASKVTLGTGTLTLGGNVNFDYYSGKPATISGGTLALGGNRTFLVGAIWEREPELTVSSVVTGGFGLTLGDPEYYYYSGALYLTGANTFTGGVTVNSGTLIVGNNQAAGGTATAGSGGLVTVGYDGALAAMQPPGATGGITIANNVRLEDGATLGDYRAPTSLTLKGLVTIADSEGLGKTVYLAGGTDTQLIGGLTALSTGTTLTFTSDCDYQPSTVILAGATNANITHVIADAGRVLFATQQAMPANIGATYGGYVGVLATSSSYLSGISPSLGPASPQTLLARITDKDNFEGVIGFDSDKDHLTVPQVYRQDLDLTGFANADYLLGSSTGAVLAGTLKVAPDAGYYFGGGGGALVVQSNLTGARNVGVYSWDGEPLTLVLRGNNTFTGGMAPSVAVASSNGYLDIVNSGVILDSPNALPAGTMVGLNYGSYFGATEAFKSASGFLALLPSLSQPTGSSGAQAYVEYSSPIIGFDSHDAIANWLAGRMELAEKSTRVVSDAINLGSLSGTVFLGTASRLKLTGPITGQGTAGSRSLQLAGYKGGSLTISSDLVSANVNSLVVGAPTFLEEDGSVVHLTGSNTFDGGTTLQGGVLLVGNDSALGTGGLTVTGGMSDVAGLSVASYEGYGQATLASASAAGVTLANAIVLDDDLKLGRDDFDRKGDFVKAGRSRLTLTGLIEGYGGLTAVNGTTVINRDGESSNRYYGSTIARGGALIFGNPYSLPYDEGYLRAESGGYLGIAFDYEGLSYDFLNWFDKANTTGAIGLDTLSGEANTFGYVDLSDFNSAARLGSATFATVNGTIEPQIGSSSYRFGGGGGILTVATALANATSPASPRNVVVDSSGLAPLTLRLTGANTYTGGTNVTQSAVIFAPGALPATGSVTVNLGGYAGTEETNATNVTTFLGRMVAGPGNSNSGFVGFDTTSLASPYTVSGNLNLTTTSVPNFYVGSTSSLLLASTASITTPGNVYRFAGYSGGTVKVDFPIASGSVVVGEPSTPATAGKHDGTAWSTVTLAGNSAYSGGTDFYAGRLVVGGSGTTAALGTGAVRVQPNTFSDDEEARLLEAQSTVTAIPNNLVLNAELSLLVNGGNNLSLTGVLSGSDELYKVGSGILTLTGANTFTGGIYIAEGSVIFGSSTAAGFGPLALGGPLAPSASFTSATPTINGLFGDSNLDHITLGSGTTLTVNQTFDSRYAGYFTGTDSASKVAYVGPSSSNPTRLVLTGASTYAGGTTVGSGVVVVAGADTLGAPGAITSSPFGTGSVTLGGGKLAIDSGTVFSNPLVLTSGSIGGSGTVKPTAKLIIGTGLALAPGNTGPGELHFDNAYVASGPVLELAGGGTYQWQLMDAINANGGWDTISVAGTVSITATSAAPFAFKLTTVASDGVPTLATNFSPTVSYSWNVLSATSITGFDAAAFNLTNVSSFLNSPTLATGIFSLSINSPTNTILTLNFTPVPEPSTYLLLAAGLGFVVFTMRRRRS